MQKIVSLFQRNYETDRCVRDEVVPGAEWVVAGEGVATRKFDGTCCLVRDGKLYKRYEVKPGGRPPADFEPANEVDAVTGKQQGWVPVSETNPSDRWHLDAWKRCHGNLPDGTYELLGPKVQGNAEADFVQSITQDSAAHLLLRHGAVVLPDVPRDFVGIRDYLQASPIEGVVWHHPDGRMVKIKRKDFGRREK